MVLKQIRCSEIRSEGSVEREPIAAIEALVDSIRQHGVLRPVLLRPTEEGFVIVHGERRWRAAQMIGLKVIPAFLVDNLSREPREVHFA
jgi:ParB family chromosome partitioning protein